MNDKSLFFLHDNATENTSHAASSLARPTPSRAWGKEGGEVEGGGEAPYIGFAQQQQQQQQQQQKTTKTPID